MGHIQQNKKRRKQLLQYLKEERFEVKTYGYVTPKGWDHWNTYPSPGFLTGTFLDGYLFLIDGMNNEDPEAAQPARQLKDICDKL